MHTVTLLFFTSTNPSITSIAVLFPFDVNAIFPFDKEEIIGL